MDPAEEQAMEIEALQAILMDDLHVYEGRVPDGWPADAQIYSIILSPLEDGSVERDKAPALLQFLFAHTPGYPAEPPLVRLRSEKGLSDARVASASAVVDRVVGEHLGTPMVYDLITAAREWLMEAAGQATQEAEDEMDHVKARKREERELRDREAQRAKGTAVTPASFAEWKERFDAEAALQQAKLMDVRAHEERMKRPTGRQWFEAGKHAADEEPLGEGDEDGMDGIGEGGDSDEDDDEGFLAAYGRGGEGSDGDVFDDDDDDEDDEDYVEGED